MHRQLDNDAAVANSTKTIIVAVLPDSLSRLVEYRLHGIAKTHILARSTRFDTLLADAVLLNPDVIVTNERLLGSTPGRAIADLKRFSPHTKIVLIRPAEEFEPERRRCGADAYIKQEAIVRRLLPAVERL